MAGRFAYQRPAAVALRIRGKIYFLLTAEKFELESRRRCFSSFIFAYAMPSPGRCRAPVQKVLLRIYDERRRRPEYAFAGAEYQFVIYAHCFAIF